MRPSTSATPPPPPPPTNDIAAQLPATAGGPSNRTNQILFVAVEKKVIIFNLVVGFLSLRKY
jgi:hypothetical protein